MASTQKSIRWIQSLNYTLHAREVGVMNVLEKDGAVVAHLSVFDPASQKDDDVYVKAGDELAVGDQRYRVVTVVTASGGERAWLEVAPIGDDPGPN
jgi:hypothetical protein